MPLIVGEMNVWPKHWWEGKDASGKPRDITKTTPNRRSAQGHTKSRRPAPANGSPSSACRITGQGSASEARQNNFDTIEFQYYDNQSVSMEAFKAGQYDFRREPSAKTWATSYDFPAVTDGRVVKRGDIVLETPKPTQGFAFNLRRQKFQDPRVRRAFNLAFDFEWANKNLFYGQYTRTSSFFRGRSWPRRACHLRRNWRCSSRFAIKFRPRSYPGIQKSRQCNGSRFPHPSSRGCTPPERGWLHGRE